MAGREGSAGRSYRVRPRGPWRSEVLPKQKPCRRRPARRVVGAVCDARWGGGTGRVIEREGARGALLGIGTVSVLSQFGWEGVVMS